MRKKINFRNEFDIAENILFSSFNPFSSGLLFLLLCYLYYCFL